jgi:GTP-binding protein EngB required for normal cell division
MAAKEDPSDLSFGPAKEDVFHKVPYGEQETENCGAAETLQSDLCKTVMVFGLSGHGKSTFLNFTLRQDIFKASNAAGFGNLKCVTKEVQSENTTVKGQQLLLVDTPGFMDTEQIEKDNEQCTSLQFHNKSQDYKLDFLKNLRIAFLHAGEKVGAFLLVCNPTVRWTFEMTTMIQFLETLPFPWDHCIIVLTHGDAVYPGKPEEARYKELNKAMVKESEIPKQLKKLIKNCSTDRVLIVESTRRGDDEYHHSVMERFLDLLERIPPYSNRHFLHFCAWSTQRVSSGSI